MLKLWSFTSAVAGAAFTFAAMPAAAGEFDGVTVNVMTQTGAIQEPLQRRAPDFEKMTGAKINIIAVPFSDLYQKVLTDWASGTNSVDAAVFAPQWMVDYVAGGYLEDLGPRIAKDKAIQWDQIAPFFRDFSATFGGKTYLIPLDGDFHMLYYRTDVFEKAGLKPPTTWDEYLDVAKALNGKDFNGDGTKGYGSCIAKKRNAQSYWFVTDIVRLDDPVKRHRPGHVLRHQGHEAPDRQRGVPQGARLPQGVRQIRAAGRTQHGRERHAAAVRLRQVRAQPGLGRRRRAGDRPEELQGHRQDRLGYHPGFEGSAELGDGQARGLHQRDTCPYAIDGINHSPYAAFGGWSGGINVKAKDKVKDAAYAFLSYMSQPKQSNEDVTIGVTGFNPYRLSQFTYNDIWKNAGMSKVAGDSYLGAIKDSLDSPNMILDLRIPQNQKYQQVVLDEAIARFLAGEIDKEATVKAVLNGWNDLNDQIGVESQLKFYKGTLGIQR